MVGGLLSGLAMQSPAYALLRSVKFLDRSEIERLIIGKALVTSFGVWTWNRESFTFESSTGRNKGKIAGPHKWSWRGDSIVSPQNSYRFYVKDNFIYIKSRGGEWKTQLRVG
jgi:hypothetical protein